METVSYTILVLTREMMKLQDIKNTIQEFPGNRFTNEKIQEFTNKIQELQNNIDYLKEFRS